MEVILASQLQLNVAESNGVWIEDVGKSYPREKIELAEMTCLPELTGLQVELESGSVANGNFMTKAPSQCLSGWVT